MCYSGFNKDVNLTHTFTFHKPSLLDHILARIFVKIHIVSTKSCWFCLGYSLKTHQAIKNRNIVWTEITVLQESCHTLWIMLYKHLTNCVHEGDKYPVRLFVANFTFPQNSLMTVHHNGQNTDINGRRYAPCNLIIYCTNDDTRWVTWIDHT